ncbi:MAG: ribonuclease P protein component [Verrucomicrobiaceae bacterium]
MRLTASRRLSRHGEFARVKADGASHAGRFVVVNALCTGTGGPWRCAFITSKKVGGAVVRNKVRRRLREILRANAHQIPDGHWVVTIARWRAAEASFDELRIDWTRAAKRAGILPQTTAQ